MELEIKHLKNLKISWKSSLENPGFLLILGLILTALSFLFFQADSLIKLILNLVICLYFVTLLFFRFPKLKVVIISILAVYVLIICLKKNQNLKPNFSQPILIYSDQIKENDGFITGTGEINSKKIVFSLKENVLIRDKIKKNESFYINTSSQEISRIKEATNPGEFDFKKYYYAKDIEYKTKIISFEVYSKSQNLNDYLHAFRAKLQKYFKKMPKLTGFMASEMVLAQNPSPSNQSVLNNYRDLGVIHLLSVSGLHVSLYVLIISYVCTLLKRTQEETILVCLILLCLEIFLTDFQAGFVRASLSYGLTALFKTKKIKVTSGDKLGLVTIIHIILNPKLFLNCGAILSYLLVLGLEFTKNNKKIKQGLQLNLLITPILLMQFYQINILTFLYNLLIVPIFNFILLPLTFIAIILSVILPKAVLIIEKIFEFIMAIMAFLAKSKLGILTFGQINWWQASIALLLTIMILINPKVTLRRISLKLVLGGIYLLFFISIHFPLYGQVSFIDVGQGDSILITTPIIRKSYLIDTGGKLSFGKRQIKPQVDQITIPFLKSQGIDKLDGIFLSHQDADHIGDLGPLLKQIKVKKIYFEKGLNKNQSFCKKIAGKIKYTELVPLLAGDIVDEKKIIFNVVYPFEEGIGKNEDSLSLAFKLAGKTWLFTGDLDRNGEKQIYKKYPIKIDYLKLGHHGSKTATDPTFIKEIKPELAIISSGRNNRFGHPHIETITTLKDNNIPYLNTQENGTIIWNYSIFNNFKLKTFLDRGN